MNINEIKQFKADSNTATVEDMFYKDTDVDMDYRNCIYRIKNLVNGKSYIGQAKNLFNRFRYGDSWSHRYGYEDGYSNLLYRALWRYNLIDFEVSVLEYDVFPELLNYLEQFWVKELHTCIYDPECWGYNMTWGGDDCSQLHTPEAFRKQQENQIANHGGYLAFNTPEHYERMKEIRGGDYMMHCHTPEAHKRKLENERLNHGGYLAFNTPEQIDALIERNKDPELILICNVGRYFTSISNNINKLKDKNKEVNWENYYHVATWDNLYFLRDHMNLMKSDDRWTEEMEFIFSNMILDSHGTPIPN